MKYFKSKQNFRCLQQYFQKQQIQNLSASIEFYNLNIWNFMYLRTTLFVAILVLTSQGGSSHYSSYFGTPKSFSTSTSAHTYANAHASSPAQVSHYGCLISPTQKSSKNTYSANNVWGQFPGGNPQTLSYRSYPSTTTVYRGIGGNQVNQPSSRSSNQNRNTIYSSDKYIGNIPLPGANFQGYRISQGGSIPSGYQRQSSTISPNAYTPYDLYSNNLHPQTGYLPNILKPPTDSPANTDYLPNILKPPAGVYPSNVYGSSEQGRRISGREVFDKILGTQQRFGQNTLNYLSDIPEFQREEYPQFSEQVKKTYPSEQIDQRGQEKQSLITPLIAPTPTSVPAHPYQDLFPAPSPTKQEMNSPSNFGAHGEMENPAQAQIILSIISSISSHYTTLLNTNNLYRATSQVVAGRNFQLMFKYSPLPSTTLFYLIKVYIDTQRKLEILQSHYYNLPTINFKDAYDFDDIIGLKDTYDSIVKKLSTIVGEHSQQALDEMLRQTVKMVKMQYSLPLFRFFFTTDNYLVVIEAVMDFFKNQVSALKVLVNPDPKEFDLPTDEQQSQPQQPSQQIIPTYIVDIDPSRYLSEITFSNPALIALLTESIDYSSTQIDEIATFLISKARIHNNFRIVLISKNDYGLRMIIEIDNTNDIFEAVLEYSQTYIELLQWRQIPSVLDLTPDVFQQYYEIEVDTEVEVTIQRILSSSTQFSQFKKILSCQKKINVDGIYQRILLMTQSQNIFEIEVYEKPETDYYEILRYQTTDITYDINREQILSSVPQNDTFFKIGFELVQSKYSNVLKDSDLTYLATYDEPTLRFYRMVFISINGKYEVMLTVAKQNIFVPRILKWEKLEDGYVPVDRQKFELEDYAIQLINKANQYIRKLFDSQRSICQDIELKNLPGRGIYYRFYYHSPVPFVLYLQRNSQSRQAIIHGIQQIPTVPSNPFYTDQLFAGFSEMKISRLLNDAYFKSIFSTLPSLKPSFDWQNSKVIAGFRKFSQSMITYQVIFNFGAQNQLFQISVNALTKTVTSINTRIYELMIGPGNYRWQCAQINSIAQRCDTCQSGYLLESGICYKKIEGCSLQYSAICFSCLPGWARHNDICLKQTVLFSSTVTSSSRSTTIKRTTTTSHYSYSSTNINADNCLQFSGQICVKCPNRYYLEDGTCKKIEDSCLTYDQTAGKCLSCYNGFHLQSYGYCLRNPSACKVASQNGQCLECQSNCLLISGRCVKYGDNPPKLGVDQNCQKRENGHCVVCFDRFQKNIQTGRCQLIDPHCLQMNPMRTRCLNCESSSYEIQNGHCQQIPIWANSK